MIFFDIWCHIDTTMPKTLATVRTTISLPGALKRKIDRYAKAQRINFNNLLKRSIETELLLAETVATGGKVVLRQVDGSEKELVLR